MFARLLRERAPKVDDALAAVLLTDGWTVGLRCEEGVRAGYRIYILGI